MDLFKAEVRCEAGLGGEDVAAHSGPIEEQPETETRPVALHLTQTKRVLLGQHSIGDRQFQGHQWAQGASCCPKTKVVKHKF